MNKFASKSHGGPLKRVKLPENRPEGLVKDSIYIEKALKDPVLTKFASY